MITNKFDDKIKAQVFSRIRYTIKRYHSISTPTAWDIINSAINTYNVISYSKVEYILGRIDYNQMLTQLTAVNISILNLDLSFSKAWNIQLNLRFMSTASGNFRYVRNLILQRCGLNKRSIDILIASDFQCINHLALPRNVICDKGIKTLVKGKYGELQRLNVSQNAFGDAGVFYLARGCWPQLNRLQMEGNRFTAHGLRELAKGNWSCLRHLYAIEGHSSPRTSKEKCSALQGYFEHDSSWLSKSYDDKSYMPLRKLERIQQLNYEQKTNRYRYHFDQYRIGNTIGNRDLLTK